MTDAASCPLPFRDHEKVTIAHGGGGRLTEELIRGLFLPSYGSVAADATADAAIVEVGDQRVAFTTDAHVVHPLEFPGGDIGTLAVNGTINDLAMVGARPEALSAAFVLEEGIEMEVVARIARSMGDACDRAGVRLVAGDTKVVDRGLADGMYVTTSGVGVVPVGVDIGPHRAVPGDVVIVSGPIGRHGIAVLSVRDGFEFGSEITSDCAPLHELVGTMERAAPGGVHVLRDLTRGGLAAALCELAETAHLGVRIDEASVPVPDAVRAACRFLGLDPIHVANEGTLVAFVAADAADEVVATMRSHGLGSGATVIGEVTSENPGVVVTRTTLGTHRVVDRPTGEQLPRIC